MFVYLIVLAPYGFVVLVPLTCSSIDASELSSQAAMSGSEKGRVCSMCHKGRYHNTEDIVTETYIYSFVEKLSSDQTQQICNICIYESHCVVK